MKDSLTSLLQHLLVSRLLEGYLSWYWINFAKPICQVASHRLLRFCIWGQILLAEITDHVVSSRIQKEPAPELKYSLEIAKIRDPIPNISSTAGLNNTMTTFSQIKPAPNKSIVSAFQKAVANIEPNSNIATALARINNVTLPKNNVACIALDFPQMELAPKDNIPAALWEVSKSLQLEKLPTYQVSAGMYAANTGLVGSTAALNFQ